MFLLAWICRHIATFIFFKLKEKRQKIYQDRLLFNFKMLLPVDNTLFLTAVLAVKVKSVRIRSFSSPCFPAFGLNKERYSTPEKILIRTPFTQSLNCSSTF